MHARNCTGGKRVEIGHYHCISRPIYKNDNVVDGWLTVCTRAFNYSQNMKFIAVVSLVVAFAYASVKADEVDEAKEMLRGLASECKGKEGASDDDVDGFVNDVPPKTRTEKCLVACMQEQFGLSNGKAFQVDGFMELSKVFMKGDDSKVAIAKEIGDDCKDVANDDRCELAVDILNCLKASAEKHGIELKH
ncbi:general odorant-binding protein 28a-like [Anopheles ziemanni]|uniref:general odorant-binding protein 28a-like n=1 Tax=Anopheles coustani TaxID=139045 RepID=UPI002657DE13|nr:general odorant-binding protein 28a-like [Anopheles coustani]XP_058169107.1 general odorant-binding protein 28a-like [Anopheles ziemanni]